jgi:predicted nucleic acid-binding protein
MKCWVVADTSVLIDLMDMGALSVFFQLPHTIATTDIVLAEFSRKDQSAVLQECVDKRQLRILGFTAAELEQLAQFPTVRKLHSIADRSVLWQSIQLQATLLTADKKLRHEAEDHGVEVRGSIGVVNELVEQGLVGPETAIKLLQRLLSANSLAPKGIIQEWIMLYQRRL